MLHPTALEDEAKKMLHEVLQNIHNTDFLWMDEILQEAIKMFKNSSDGEPELMPKTPSQKNRCKKKCISSVKSDPFGPKRLSKRSNARMRASKRVSQNKKDLEILKAEIENVSPCRRVTRSQAANSSRAPSLAELKYPVIDLAKGRIPLVEISANERRSAEFQIKDTPPQTVTVPMSSAPTKRSQPSSKTTLLVIPDTPEEKITKEGRGACKMKIANVSPAKATASEETSGQKVDQQQQNNHPSEPKATLKLRKHLQTPIAPKGKRSSVRRSLMHRTSTGSRASLVQRSSLSAKREIMILRQSTKSFSKQELNRKSAACRRASSQSLEELLEEENIESGAKLDSVSHSQKIEENLKKSLCSNKTEMSKALRPQEIQHKGDCEEDSSGKSSELQKQPLSARRKPSYKRAINDRDEQQPTEDELSPPRKRAPSPQYPASKVVRPFKTFLHTVQKNQMLMMTPSSVRRNSIKKSFLKKTTPLHTTPKEKERQRLENLKKKEEAEQQRKQKMEEEKKRRMEEMKRKREERLHKVLQARERVEQLEEKKKKRIEQKFAQYEEKNEKAREEKMAEDKMKKRVAAKKLEEHEARRKQEEEARKQKALQLEDEDRKYKEQKKREEEQEKARKIAERQAELEKEKKLCAERELEKKREQEKIQAQREHDQQQKEKADRLQREVLAAAKEKERLQKELEERERKLREQQKQEEELLKKTLEAQAKAANKQLNVTVDCEKSPVCNSYQMTPQNPKQLKMDLNNYGMDLNSDDSTDDESQPRKPIPTWATGNQLSQSILHQYYNPPNIKALFGAVKSPRLEEIFYKKKPQYFKRTSSAVWNSPPFSSSRSVPSAFQRC